LTTNTLTNK